MTDARAPWSTRLRELLLEPLLPEVVHPRDDDVGLQCALPLAPRREAT